MNVQKLLVLCSLHIQYFLGSKIPCSDKSRDGCSTAAVLFPTKTSRAVTRARKLETRKTKNTTVKFKVPPIAEILSGEWLSDLHIKAASDLLKIQFPWFT